MSQHPLVDLSRDGEVRQAKGFRQAAAALSGESLGAAYREEVAQAPRREGSGRAYIGVRTSRVGRELRAGREGEHLAQALVASHSVPEAAVALGDEESLRFLDYAVPLEAAGSSEKPIGLGRVDLLGATTGGRLVVVQMKFVPAGANRVGTGDTPLRALLEGLARCAAVKANQEVIRAEAADVFGAELSDQDPILIVLGSRRYWELCRKREAQKGAAWIQQLERLQRECEEQFGMDVRYLTIDLSGDPGWEYAEAGPKLVDMAKLAAAWEPGAGRVKPKPKPRPKTSTAPVEVIVEADLSRPPRTYSIRDSYAPGDRIAHPTLGEGVVQGGAGPGKIQVRFGERKSLLVHERA
ncbi:MAG: hypothetical protein MJE66_10695 [Proteobacteria bacterium]|nr:hypothetical protein [Pseudomonadota bacterium]